MPSITIIAPNYFPETNAGAKRITRLAEHLVRTGWEVTVYTVLPHHPQNRIYVGYEDLANSTRVEKGVTVTRVRPWLVAKDNLVMRLIAESLATLKLAARILGNGQFSDLYFVSSPYMFLGPAGLFISKLRRKPFVWDVRDLTWLYPRASGKRTFGLDRLLEALMRWTARSSDALTTATEGLFTYFRQRPELGKPIPNGVSVDVLDALEATARKGPPTGPSRAVYIGLFGYNHGLSTVVEAARLLPDVRFVFVGDGPDRPMLEEAAMALTNVEVHGFKPFDELIEFYDSATVLISHVRKNPIFEWTQPAKLWEYMASGRPVVHAGEGEVIGIIEAQNIAVTVPPEDAPALASAVESLVSDLESAKAIGARGRKYSEVERNSAVIFGEMDALLRTVSGPRG